jgi:hypothetical protein
MRRTFALLLLSTIGLGAAACDEESRVVEMRVDHYEEPCWGGNPGFCLRIIESSDPDVDAPDEIIGFEHEWGTVSDLSVLVTEMPDGTLEYDLLEVESQTEVTPDIRFQMPLGPEFVESVDTYGFELVSDKPVVCASAEVCEAVSQAMFESADFEVELGYPRTRGGSFVAYRVDVLE